MKLWGRGPGPAPLVEGVVEMSNRVYSTRLEAIQCEIVEPCELGGLFLTSYEADDIAAQCIVSECRNGSMRYWCELDDDEFWDVVESVVEGA